MVEIKRVLVPYSSEEDRKKLEDYIREVTGRQVNLGPIGYGGTLTLQTLDVDFRKIGATNVTCAPHFPGKHCESVDAFIKWHRNMVNENRMKFYDHVEGLVRQIPVVFDDLNECSRLVSFIEEKGYKGNAGTGEKEALYLDNRTRSYYEPSITTMACWCSGRRYPLNVDEFIENYERIITDNDIDFYHGLIETKWNEKRI